MTARPALPLVLFFSAGIIVSVYLMPGPAHMALSLVVILLAASVFRNNPVPALCFVMLAGAWYACACDAHNRYSPLRQFHGKRVLAGATIVSAERKDDRCSMRIRVHQVLADGMLHRYDRKPLALVSVKGSRDFRACDYIEINGIFEPLMSPVNPGCFNFEQACARKGIHDRMTLREGDLSVTGWKGGANPLVSAAQWLKERMKAPLYRNHCNERAVLLSGIVFGEKNSLPDDLAAAFRMTGTLHLLAASGLNVGILTGAVLALGRLMGFRGKYCAVAAVPLIMLYALMAGASACIIRAALMALLVIGAGIVERESDLINTLSASAFIMLLMDPFTLFDAGFQMSVGAVAGIALSIRPARRIKSLVPPLIASSMELVVLSCGVQIVLAPIMAYTFFNCSLLSPFCNLLAVPPAGILLYGGLLEGCAGMIFPPLGIIISLADDLLLGFLIAAVKTMSHIPLCSMPVMRPSLSGILLYYCGAAMLFYLLNGGRIPDKKCIFRAAVPVMVMLLLCAASAVLTERDLRIVFLDVGEGDALWIHMPSGENIMLDGGERSQFDGHVNDRGSQILIPFLKGMGVGRLDHVILSHCHDDHAGGLVEVAGTMTVDSFLEGSSRCSDDNYIMLKAVLESRNVPCHRLIRGDSLNFHSGVSIRVLSPAKEEFRPCDPNRESLVLRLSFQGRNILCMGDLDREGEEELLRERAVISADLIKVGHHGSAGSTSPAFLDAAAPRYAVISAGRGNRHGHPSPSVIERLARRNIEVFRTDRDGAVVVTIGKRGLHVDVMRK